jgi:hypothetical protein
MRASAIAIFLVWISANQLDCVDVRDFVCTFPGDDQPPLVESAESSDGGGPVTTWARDCAATIVNIISPTNGEELSHSLVEFVIDAYGFKSGDADKTGGIGHVRDPASQSHP